MVTSPPSELKPPIKIARRTIEVPCFRERLSDTVAIEMMAIPAGELAMGSPEGELDREECEGPQHPVQVPSCWMGKYPVTQAQWRIVADWPQVDRALNPDPSHFKGDNRPVERVNWHEAVEFCHRLSAHTKRPYRLPSEAKWEYACRAGTTSPFHFGETITTKLANYRGTDREDGEWSGAYGGGPLGEYRQATTPVDQFGVANAFGLCDMHGNVWEWCQDLWHENYRGAPTDGSAWLEAGDECWFPRCVCRPQCSLTLSLVSSYVKC
jgi:formylglycine-generating enzyme required for sulfatase activity